MPQHVQSRRFVDAIGCSMAVWLRFFTSKTVTCGFGYLFFISFAAFSAASYVPNPDFSCRSTATQYCSLRGTVARIGAPNQLLSGVGLLPRLENFRCLCAAVTANPPPPHASPPIRHHENY